MLDDDDSVVTGPDWQWARAGTDIDGATLASYTVAEEDADMSLMATATYDDVHGTGKMVSATVMIAAATVVGQYDTDGTPGISILELYAAIDDYFDGEINPVELFELIDAYFG